MRPVTAHICLYDALYDTRLTLEDFARMNDALDVQQENQARYNRAVEAARRAKQGAR